MLTTNANYLCSFLVFGTNCQTAGKLSQARSGGHDFQSCRYQSRPRDGTTEGRALPEDSHRAET